MQNPIFDELNAPARENALGDAPVRGPHGYVTKCLADIQQYSGDTDTYIVVTRGVPGRADAPGGQQYRGVPRIKPDSGKLAPYALGTTVVLDMSLGFPYIAGELNINAMPRSGIAPINLGGSTTDKSAVAAVNNNCRGDGGNYVDANAPQGALPGDQVTYSPEGNYVGVLRGKLNKIYGSEKAQIITSGLHDLVKIISEDYTHFSSLGELKIYNVNGRASLEFNGGADQLTESGGSESQWTMHVKMGDIGDLFLLEITGQDGATKAQIHLSADGKVTLLSTNGMDFVCAGDTPRIDEVGSNWIRKTEGDVRETVGGGTAKTVNGNSTTKISGTAALMSGNDITNTANRHEVNMVGGNRIEVVTGGLPIYANPTNLAIDSRILNGSVQMDIGNPLQSANPAAMAGYRVYVYNGTITLGENPLALTVSKPLCHVELNTMMPDSVALGGQLIGTNMAVYHAMKFELWQSLMTTLLALFDSHTHPSAVGPTGVPLFPMSPVIAPMITSVMSVRVKIGL